MIYIYFFIKSLLNLSRNSVRFENSSGNQFSGTYLSTLPHKSGISRFSDPFTTSRSYLKISQFSGFLDHLPIFISLLKLKNPGYFYHLFLRVFTVFEGEGRPHFRLGLENFRSVPVVFANGMQSLP